MVIGAIVPGSNPAKSFLLSPAIVGSFTENVDVP